MFLVYFRVDAQLKSECHSGLCCTTLTLQMPINSIRQPRAIVTFDAYRAYLSTKH